MAKKNIADKYWIYGEDAELAARLTSYLTRVVYNQRANYIRALMKIKEHECSIEDCDSDIESQSMRSGNSLEESIESKLMWEAIRKYLPKLELKECEVMIALYIDRLSVTATAAKLRVDASTVRRRRDSACDKIRKAIHPHMFRHTFVSLLMSNPDIGVATVAAEAGHAQPSTTLMIYTQQYKKRRESIRNQLSRELYEK